MKTTMKAMAVAVLAAALALGCSGSTSPSDPFAGTWNVTVQRLVWLGESPPDTGTISPEPVTFIVAKSGQSYTASWPGVTWSVRISGTQRDVTLAGIGSAPATVSGDTLEVDMPESFIGPGCQLQVRGVFQGSSAHGALHIAGGQCGAEGSFTASRQ